MKYSDSSDLPREGDLIDGKYLIRSLLGMGGMAAVFAAKHVGFDRMVALKILLPEASADPTLAARFLQEGKAAVKIRSEHVVRVLDVGTAAEQAYLVMEYLDGEDLEALLRRGGALPVSTAVDLVLQACEAVGEAHALGIVHRDLKPANLFLSHRADGTPCMKVLDFGISKVPREWSALRPEARTIPSVFMGSPRYMSPEQMLSASAVDARSDIWSLGAVLHELLTGQPAFEGPTNAVVCARVREGTPAPIAAVRPEVPAPLAAAITRCLEKKPSRRYANVGQLARALAPFGSPGARASAECIARVIRRRADAGRLSLGSAGSIKATAAEILAEPARPHRVSGYLLGSILLMATMCMLAGVARPGASPWASHPAVAPSIPVSAATAPRERAASDDAGAAGACDGRSPSTYSQ
jgi:serine/threonine-protein kinase